MIVVCVDGVQLVGVRDIRGRVELVGRARVAPVERNALPLEAHLPADRFFCGVRVVSACNSLELRGAVKVRVRTRVWKRVCV